MLRQMSLLGQNRGDRMKENKLYFKKGRHINRIIRVFNEHGDGLSTMDIMNFLNEQTDCKGSPYANQPAKGKVSQYLCKYPYFERMGTRKQPYINGSSTVAIWKLAEDRL